MGVSLSARRNFFTISSTLAMPAPDFSARTDEACTTGPSAIGSVKGMPNSITSAPAAGSFSRMAKLVSMSGSPAVMKGTKAARPSCSRRAKVSDRRVTVLPCSYLFTQSVRHRENVLVTAARQANRDELVLAHLAGQLCDMGDGMGGFQRRDNAFQLGEQHESVQRLLVGDGMILHPADILEPAMFGTDAGIVQACRNGMGFQDLAVMVLQKVRARAMQHAG